MPYKLVGSDKHMRKNQIETYAREFFYICHEKHYSDTNMERCHISYDAFPDSKYTEVIYKFDRYDSTIINSVANKFVIGSMMADFTADEYYKMNKEFFEGDESPLGEDEFEYSELEHLLSEPRAVQKFAKKFPKISSFRIRMPYIDEVAYTAWLLDKEGKDHCFRIEVTVFRGDSGNHFYRIRIVYNRLRSCFVYSNEELSSMVKERLEGVDELLVAMEDFMEKYEEYNKKFKQN